LVAPDVSWLLVFVKRKGVPDCGGLVVNRRTTGPPFI
jgi:hypothetical protein